MKQYLDLVDLVVKTGQPRSDRTGVGTRSVFGHQMRFNLQEGFPLLTTKYTHFPAVVAELLWFLRGQTNSKELNELGSTIWDEWATEAGNLGPIYGHQWRSWVGANIAGEMKVIDQIAELIKSLSENPDSRRHIISAWNPIDLPDESASPQENAKAGRQALPPCHVLAQFWVGADNTLHCQVYQRSADIFLGVPFNIASYALLTSMLAHHLEMGVGDLVWTGGDCHLYSNHMVQVYEMMNREPLPLCSLELNYSSDKRLEDVEPAEIAVKDYLRHAALKAQVAI